MNFRRFPCRLVSPQNHISKYKKSVLDYKDFEEESISTASGVWVTSGYVYWRYTGYRINQDTFSIRTGSHSQRPPGTWNESFKFWDLGQSTRGLFVDATLFGGIVMQWAATLTGIVYPGRVGPLCLRKDNFSEELILIMCGRGSWLPTVSDWNGPPEDRKKAFSPHSNLFSLGIRFTFLRRDELTIHKLRERKRIGKFLPGFGRRASVNTKSVG